MKNRAYCKFYLVSILIIFFFIFTWRAESAISAAPKFLFLNSSKRSIPVTVINQGNNEVEVWLDIKFGYIVSDDSGKVTLIYDSTGTPPQSAVGWIKMYPERFKLGPLESQVVRITASPQSDLPDGEYWARILIASQDVKFSLVLDKDKKKTGIEFIQRIGLPFHYRKGEVTSGLDIQNFDVEVTEKTFNTKLEMKRSGNASYWGVALFHLYNDKHQLVWSTGKDIAVFTYFNGVFRLVRPELQSGQYTLEVELKTEGRRDVRKTDLIQVPPIRLTKSLIIN